MSAIHGRTAILATPLLLFAASEATAQLRFCNRAPYPIATAVVHPSGKQWVSKGWWPLSPGECAWVIGGSGLKNQYYYVYAEASGELAQWANGGSSVQWGGDHYFCVASGEPFTLNTSSPCTEPRGRVVGFTEVNTKDADEFTYEFWDDDRPATRKNAAALSAQLRKQMKAEQQAERDAAEVRERLAKGRCADMPPFRMASQPYSTSVVGRTVTLSPVVTVDFQGGGGNTTRVDAVAEIGLEELERFFRQQTSRKALGIPGDNCNHRFHLEHDVGASGGKMTTKVGLRYENWACCKKCNPCGTLTDPFRMCDATTRVETVESEVKVVWTARVVNQSRGVDVTTEAWTRSGTEGFVTSVTGVLGLGDEYQNRIQKEVNQAIGGTLNQLLDQLGWREESLIPHAAAFRTRITAASFRMSGGHPALVLEATGEVPTSQSCSVYRGMSGSSLGRTR